MEVLGIVQAGSVDPSALIIVHAEGVDGDTRTRLAEAGAWIEFDAVRPGSAGLHARLVTTMIDAGFAGRILLSHDAGWYDVGKPDGGMTRPYTTIIDELVPALKEANLSNRRIAQLLSANPSRAYAVRVRKQ